MVEYEFLEHTADTGFRAWGGTLEELFIHSAEALVAAALDASEAEAYEPRQMAAAGATIEDRLVNWLNEVLWLLDGERFVPARFEAVWFEGETVCGQLLGERRDDVRHPPRVVVKAATYHQLAVREHNGRWEAEVFLDV